jgi:hypothetical protein
MSSSAKSSPDQSGSGSASLITVDVKMARHYQERAEKTQGTETADLSGGEFE